MRLFISSPISPAAVHAGGWRWALTSWATCGALKKTFEKEEDDDEPLESNVGRGFMAGMISGNVMRVLG